MQRQKGGVSLLVLLVGLTSGVGCFPSGSSSMEKKEKEEVRSSEGIPNEVQEKGEGSKLSSTKSVISPGPQWPETIRKGGQSLTIYQPQVDEWKENKIKARAAVRLVPQEGSPAFYGALYFEGRTHTDFVERLVVIRGGKVTRVEFPQAEQRDEEFAGIIRQLMGKQPKILLLDSILANLAQHQRKEQGGYPSYATEPPDLFWSEKPSILVSINGKPLWRSFHEGNFQYVLNTDWPLILDQQTQAYFLLAGDQWLHSLELKSGSWEAISAPPEGLIEEMKGSPLAQVQDVALRPQKMAPEVFLSTKPAELIVFQGPPRWESVPGTSLKRVVNTVHDVFKKDSQLYLLLGGRWLSASQQEGPWKELLPSQLPADFAQIPASSPAGRVLASVPGTSEATEALILAGIPRMAKVKRDQLDLQVYYYGEPKWELIEGTDLKRAVNTKQAIIDTGEGFYCCYQGVWFESVQPKGPWKVAEQVPASIYKIPPTSSLYSVTFVKVEKATSEVVIVGYTAGYLGAMIEDGAVVYGTGYHYRPYIDGDVYIHGPQTYGGDPVYNSDTGLFDYGRISSQPYYNPHKGMQLSGEIDEAGSGCLAYDPYLSWPQGVEPIETERDWNEALGMVNKGIPAQANELGDLYVGKDGHIYQYRHDKWYRSEGKKWVEVAQGTRWIQPPQPARTQENQEQVMPSSPPMPSLPEPQPRQEETLVQRQQGTPPAPAVPIHGTALARENFDASLNRARASRQQGYSRYINWRDPSNQFESGYRRYVDRYQGIEQTGQLGSGYRQNQDRFQGNKQSGQMGAGMRQSQQAFQGVSESGQMGSGYQRYLQKNIYNRESTIGYGAHQRTFRSRR